MSPARGGERWRTALFRQIPDAMGLLMRAVRAGLPIAEAVRMAGAGDIILLAGKGHETGQIVGGKTFDFSDHDEVKAALPEKVA